MGPFDDFKAQELTEDKQNAFFVKPKHVMKLYSYGTCFIVGERGSGKTTILRHLEQTFDEHREHNKIAVYYRFETSYMKSLYNRRLEEDDNITNFSQSIYAILCKIICRKLIALKKSVDFKMERDICNDLYDLMADEFKLEATFDNLYRAFEKIRKQALFNFMNRKIELLFDYHNIFENFVDALRKENEFSKVCLCILMDEYENLAVFQQKVINSMVKNSSDKVTFRICLRPEGFWTKETVVQHEQLMDPDDYKSVDYVRDIMGTDTDIQKMMRQVCYNRLLFYYKQQQIAYQERDLDIDNYLEIQTEEKELAKIANLKDYKEELQRRIIEKADEKAESLLVNISDIMDLQLIDILLEKKYKFDEIYKEFMQKGKRYIDWKHNYRVNAFYIILDECREKKKYGGLDIILKLTNYNVRIVLSILSDCFDNFDFSKVSKNQIKISAQDNAIKEIAKREFEQIGYIPIYGYEIKNLTTAMGKIFKKYLVDKRASKFEVNSFSIVATGELKAENNKYVSDVLKNAVIWGIFTEDKSNKIKNQWGYSYDDKDYVLHPIYTVYFGISYRKKQKTEIDDKEIVQMFNPVSNSMITQITNRVLDDAPDKNMIPGQITMPLDELTE